VGIYLKNTVKKMHLHSNVCILVWPNILKYYSKIYSANWRFPKFFKEQRFTSSGKKFFLDVKKINKTNF
jgi:hypothetical protein